MQAALDAADAYDGSSPTGPKSLSELFMKYFAAEIDGKAFHSLNQLGLAIGVALEKAFAERVRI